jgi:hypothetical protein
VSLLLPVATRAQDVVVRDAGTGRGGDIVRRTVAGPHVVRAGTTPLELPRDSTIASSLLVLGRPTYLAGRVQGDVVVVGADLFLRPGVEVTGRAVAIGGTVAETALGRVAGGVESLRDESLAIEKAGGGYALDYRSLRVGDDEQEPIVQLAGLYGLQQPAYDRVNGVSLPVGVVFQFGNHAVEIAPGATYRSRLGTVDGALSARTDSMHAVYARAHVARDTRTNDAWIYGDLVNSAGSLFTGSDTRNYFRADGGDARVYGALRRESYALKPYVGALYERVRSITAIGNVWSMFGRRDTLRMARPNPLVEPGNVGSALLGAEFDVNTDVVTSRFHANAEQSYTAPTGTSNFFQLTLDGTVEFPTIRSHRLAMRAHGVATTGSAVPRARYAYLGGGGTLRTLERLEQGGTALLYVESLYKIPLAMVQLPHVEPPVITLRDAFGGAGVGALPALQHEIGIGIGVSMVRVEYTHSVAGRSGSEFGVGVSFSMPK